jgi:hypothetical protein
MLQAGEEGAEMKKTITLLVVLLTVGLWPGICTATGIVGKWGTTVLSHLNNGTWYVRRAEVVFNNDHTGTFKSVVNDNGSLGSLEGNFQYSSIVRKDGGYFITET